jgi:predicted nucleic acid-binding protein
VRSMTSGFMSRIGKNATIVDTSAHYALVDENDRHHEEAMKFAEELSRQRIIWVVTNFIIAETYGLMLLKLGRHIAINFLEHLLRSVEDGTTYIVRVTEADEERAWEILETYADQDFSYVDATTFAVMERLNLDRAFAFDRHFETFRLRGRRPIIRLP